MRPDSVRILLRVAHAAHSGTFDRLSHQEAYAAYVRCTQLLTPEALAQAVERYCEQSGSAERIALAYLFHHAFRQVVGPRARLWARVDPGQASAAQIAQMYLTARQQYPGMLDRLLQPDGADAGASSRRAVAGIAAEAVTAILRR